MKSMLRKGPPTPPFPTRRVGDGYQGDDGSGLGVSCGESGRGYGGPRTGEYPC